MLLSYVVFRNVANILVGIHLFGNYLILTDLDTQNTQGIFVHTCTASKILPSLRISIL